MIVAQVSYTLLDLKRTASQYMDKELFPTQHTNDIASDVHFIQWKHMKICHQTTNLSWSSAGKNPSKLVPQKYITYPDKTSIAEVCVISSYKWGTVISRVKWGEVTCQVTSYFYGQMTMLVHLLWNAWSTSVLLTVGCVTFRINATSCKSWIARSQFGQSCDTRI